MPERRAYIAANRETLSDLLQLTLAAPARPWPEWLAAASRALGDVPLRLLERRGGAWAATADSAWHDAPRAVARRESDGYALLAGAPVDEQRMDEVFGVLLCAARMAALAERTRAAEDAYETLRDCAFEGVIIHKGGILLEVNQATADLYGYTRQEMVGMHMSQLIAPEYLAKVTEIVATAQPGPYETMALCHDGTTVPLEARARTCQYKGQTVRFAAFRDLRQLRETLRELEASREAAERANRHKTSFLGDVSHELRTPLNAVLGVNQLLQDTTLDDDQRRLLELQRVSAHGVLELINDLLDLTRIEEGRFEIRPSPFELLPLLEVALRSPRRLRTGVTAMKSFSEVLAGHWLGDDRRILQVLLNLLDNAAKYTLTGNIWFEAFPQGEGVTFVVRDTGVGMSPDIQGRLFQRFERGDIAGENPSGTGLGLHISHELARRMGGTLTVQSIVGEGSEFTLWLPLPRAEGDLPVPKSAEGAEGAEGTALRVLVAEDTGVNQFILRRLVESLGHEVIVVESGRAAIDAVLGQHFDAVLMDLEMPDVDGATATTMLRARGQCVPIFALTAHTLPAEQDRCLAAGMNGVVTKPLSRDRLLDVLQPLRNMNDRYVAPS
ncbi:MAG: ATP-binding protein [Myxococcota bacterium]